jgi:hypothetical protein
MALAMNLTRAVYSSIRRAKPEATKDLPWPAVFKTFRIMAVGLLPEDLEDDDEHIFSPKLTDAELTNPAARSAAEITSRAMRRLAPSMDMARIPAEKAKQLFWTPIFEAVRDGLQETHDREGKA